MWLVLWLMSMAYCVHALPGPFKGAKDFLPQFMVDNEVDTNEVSIALSSRNVDSFGEVADVKCGYFIKQEGKSLYGWNTKRIMNVAVAECWRMCASETSFYCRSVDFNADSSTHGDSTTCYLSSESAETQPEALDKNFNTDYYERSCEPPNVEPASSGDGGIVI